MWLLPAVLLILFGPTSGTPRVGRDDLILNTTDGIVHVHVMGRNKSVLGNMFLIKNLSSALISVIYNEEGPQNIPKPNSTKPAVQHDSQGLLCPANRHSFILELPENTDDVLEPNMIVDYEIQDKEVIKITCEAHRMEWKATTCVNVFFVSNYFSYQNGINDVKDILPNQDCPKDIGVGQRTFCKRYPGGAGYTNAPLPAICTPAFRSDTRVIEYSHIVLTGNLFITPGEQMISSVADATGCVYSQGSCITPDGYLLLWNATTPLPPVWKVLGRYRAVNNGDTRTAIILSLDILLRWTNCDVDPVSKRATCTSIFGDARAAIVYFISEEHPQPNSGTVDPAGDLIIGIPTPEQLQEEVTLIHERLDYILTFQENPIISAASAVATGSQGIIQDTIGMTTVRTPSIRKLLKHDNIITYCRGRYCQVDVCDLVPFNYTVAEVRVNHESYCSIHPPVETYGRTLYLNLDDNTLEVEITEAICKSMRLIPFTYDSQRLIYNGSHTVPYTGQVKHISSNLTLDKLLVDTDKLGDKGRSHATQDLVTNRLKVDGEINNVTSEDSGAGALTQSQGLPIPSAGGFFGLSKLHSLLVKGVVTAVVVAFVLIGVVIVIIIIYIECANRSAGLL